MPNYVPINGVEKGIFISRTAFSLVGWFVLFWFGFVLFVFFKNLLGLLWHSGFLKDFFFLFPFATHLSGRSVTVKLCAITQYHLLFWSIQIC